MSKLSTPLPHSMLPLINFNFSETNGNVTLSNDNNKNIENDGDATRTSRSVVHYSEADDKDHRHHSAYSTSSSDLFYEDNTLEQMTDDDVISGPDVTSIFCG